jgi:hypothetical protein
MYRNIKRQGYRFLILFALLLPAAPAALAQEGGVFTEPAQTYTLTKGWYQGRETFYYDFGMNSPVLNNGAGVGAAPIYVLVTGFDGSGNPQMVEGQRNIIDVVPGEPGYSDLWEVNFVTVPAGYVANTFKSADDVRKAGLQMTKPGVLVNCPVVPLNSRLAEPVNGSVEPTRGWYKGSEVHYFDFGPNSNRTAPIYAFITGFSADGTPQFVQGQNNIIDVIPGDAGYSAFWDVHLVRVPAGYKPNSITSAAGVMSSGFEIVRPGLVVNCPVTRTSNAVTGSMMEMPGMPNTGAGDTPLPLVWYLLAAGMLLAAGVAFRRTAKARSRR